MKRTALPLLILFAACQDAPRDAADAEYSYRNDTVAEGEQTYTEANRVETTLPAAVDSTARREDQ
ncbi:MAG: hypothetical protein WBA12_04355 [Catalinimonas sp.]